MSACRVLDRCCCRRCADGRGSLAAAVLPRAEDERVEVRRMPLLPDACAPKRCCENDGLPLGGV